MASTSAPLLCLSRIGKSYGRETALVEMDLQAHAGEFIVLLGPNGAGKTTLVQVITGLLAPDSGRVEIMGRDVAVDPVGALGGIGVVFQQQTLDLELSLRANLRFHADLHGLDPVEATRRIASLLGDFGLAERARDRVRTLSGGNRRRLELARALLHRPRVLIMDEATAGLDPASRADLIARVLELRRSGVLVLWTTHLLDEAESADRVLILARGRLVYDGPPGAVGTATMAENFHALTGGAGDPKTASPQDSA